MIRLFFNGRLTRNSLQPKLSDELFNELWRNALEDVKEREEILVENVEVKVPEKKVDGEKERYDTLANSIKSFGN